MEPMLSYAGNFEDVLLRRAFGDQVQGFYIDIGAYDPVSESVTKYFYDRGWRGINVEPDPAPFQRLLAARPDEVNLNLGLSDQSGWLRLFTADSAPHPSVEPGLLTGWFGARPDDLREQRVPVITLAELCASYVPEGQTIDFLKIDVEGHEPAVIRGGDWQRWRPRIVIAESFQPEAWEPRLTEAGYRFTLFDGINRFYVRQEDEDLRAQLAVPVNSTDQFRLYGYEQQIADLKRRFELYERLEARLKQASRRMMGDRFSRALITSTKSLLRRIAG